MIVPECVIDNHKRSISNHNKEFLNDWDERLRSFSLTLTSDLLTHCKKTIETVSLEITETQNGEKLLGRNQLLRASSVSKVTQISREN